MAQENLRNLRADARELFELRTTDKPTIKILLYTDAPEFVTDRRVGAFSLGRMLQHLRGHSPAFARFDVRLESRYRNSLTANNKLNDILEKERKTGAQFDQIWFFGIHQINKRNRSLNFRGGTPESELTEEESRALQVWMDEHHGGVLVTGDHANERPRDAIDEDPNSLFPDTARKEQFLSLGRALGRGIPRAGKLRDWEGDPTSLPGRTFNTTSRRQGVSNDSSTLERDPIAQRIDPRHFDDSGRPTSNGKPHPLFFYNNDHPIQFLPDHMHEGTVKLPDLTDGTWKRNADGFRPEPHVVATGIDADTGKSLALVVAFDGTAVDQGRIVADSSWHHYFNVNLEGLLFPAPAGSAADQIGQFYANLAIWLSPIEKRQQMSDVMIEWLAYHPVILEEFDPIQTKELTALLRTGGTALALLKRVASPCEIHELLQMTFSQKRRQQVETLHLPENGDSLTALPSKQMLLGYLVNQATKASGDIPQVAFATRARFTESVRADLINAAELAFQRQQRAVIGALNIAEKLSFRINSGSRADLEAQLGFESSQGSYRSKERLNALTTFIENTERSTAMAACDTRPWDIRLRIDNDFDHEEGISFTDLNITGGIIIGNVRDRDGLIMSALRGRCVPSVATGHTDMSHLEFVFNIRDVRDRTLVIRMHGVGYELPGQAVNQFRGEFRAYEPYIGDVFSFTSPDIPPMDGRLHILAFDEGDTGSGNGTQT